MARWARTQTEIEDECYRLGRAEAGRGKAPGEWLPPHWWDNDRFRLCWWFGRAEVLASFGSHDEYLVSPLPDLHWVLLCEGDGD